MLFPVSLRSDVYMLFHNPLQKAMCWKHIVHTDMAKCANTHIINQHTTPILWLHWPCKLLLSLLPCPAEGGPLPEPPSNKSSWLLLAALILGFPSVQMPSALCLSISPSFLFSCLFLKNKKRCEEICCCQQSRSLLLIWTSKNVTCRRKPSQLFQLWKMNRCQGKASEDAMNLDSI